MVWDIWVRFGHWLVVIAVAFQLYSGDVLDLRDFHAWVGIGLLSWVGFRLLWGFTGPKHARFSDFLAGPIAIFNSFAALVRRQPEHRVGHTYAGGVGIVVLMLLLGGLAVTGLVGTDDIFYDAPLNYLVSPDLASEAMKLHRLMGDVLIVVVIAHVSAVLWHQFVLKEPLINAMVTGRKPGADGTLEMSTTLRGLVLILISAGAIAGTIALIGRF